MLQTVAACCGLFGFRSTPGMVQLDGVETVLGSIDTLGWTTRDALLLQRVGAAYGLPGGGQPDCVHGLLSPVLWVALQEVQCCMMLLRMGRGAAGMACWCGLPEVGAVFVVRAAQYSIACHALLQLQDVAASCGLPGSWSCAVGPAWQSVALPAVCGFSSRLSPVGPLQCGLLNGLWVRCSLSFRHADTS